MKILNVLFLFLVPLVAGCAPATQNPEMTSIAISTLPVPPTESPAIAISTLPILPTVKPLSFAPATYRDEANGFELDYPSDWSIVPNTQIGSRGSQALLFSPGTTAEALADGGTRVSIVIYSWDPKGDLAAYVAHRRPAWESGGTTILFENTGQLIDGRSLASFSVQAPDGLQSFFMLTTLGERYLQIAGEGNLGLIDEIANTVRPLNFIP